MQYNQYINLRGFETVLFVLVAKLTSPLLYRLKRFGTVLFVLVTKLS